MKKPPKYRRKNKNNTQAVPAVIGIGLILVGIALFSSLKKTDDASALVDRSVTPVSVNYPAPVLSLQNIDGQTESLNGLMGQVLLVNNWATWCPPCKAEMPTLEKYYETYQSQGFDIVAVEAGDGRDDVTAFAMDYGLQFHVWLDPDGASLDAFHNGNLPNSYVIDRSGIVRYAWTGEISFAMLEKYVTPLIVE
jgi:peroxiredoxin